MNSNTEALLFASLIFSSRLVFSNKSSHSISGFGFMLILSKTEKYSCSFLPFSFLSSSLLYSDSEIKELRNSSFSSKKTMLLSSFELGLKGKVYVMDIPSSSFMKNILWNF